MPPWTARWAQLGDLAGPMLGAGAGLHHHKGGGGNSGEPRKNFQPGELFDVLDALRVDPIGLEPGLGDVEFDDHLGY